MGWKDILRPIRDRLDDLLPPNDMDPKKRRKRQHDNLKGFTYLESFDELKAWSPQQVDPIQVSNTPLLPRESNRDPSQPERAQITLIHDYAGNYHDYECSQGLDVDQESYCCEYLQLVDTLVYFSHKLVCVPPPAWTNTLHRNGVRAFGTFIVEPGSLHVEEMLHSEATGNEGEQTPQSFPVAKQLAKIALSYGFDGWLINIEKTFPLHNWDLRKIESFLIQLRNEMEDKGFVIWYDALTVENRIQYQNSLTDENLPFLRVSGSLLTNYRWDLDKLRETRLLLQNHGLTQTDVLFGIDVWAQIRQSTDPPRITWPQERGGGTNTGIAVAELAQRNGAVGIFGPAMPFEHFGQHGKAVDRSIWEGAPLPKDLQCECSHNSRRFHPENRTRPILRTARHYAAGSRDFFYTNFARAFTELPQSDGFRAQMGSQSILPIWPRHNLPTLEDKMDSDDDHCCRHFRLLDNPFRLILSRKALSYLDSSIPETADTDERGALKVEYRPPQRMFQCPDDFILFKLAISCERPLRVQIRFRPLVADRQGCTIPIIPFYLLFASGFSQRLKSGIISDEGEHRIDEAIDFRPIGSKHAEGVTITGLSVRVLYGMLEIYEVCIQPANSATNRYSVRDVRIEERGEGELRHSRLCWQVREQISEYRDCPVERSRLADGTLDKRPWSETTGPFSHFRILIDSKEVGLAYALEYVLSEAVSKKLKAGNECKVQVVGVTFWGDEWKSNIQELPDVGRDWEFV